MKLELRLFFLSLLFASASCAANDIVIINPWIPEAPPGARVLAGFMEIQNTSSQDISIEQISSPGFKQVEIHLSTEANGIASMQQQKTLTIPANSQLILKSGSYHLMLIKPQKRLNNGDNALLRFTLSNGQTLEQIVPVKKTAMSSVSRCGSGKCGASHQQPSAQSEK